MPPSIVEKYEQILAADPRSRIFVELAKALVERGEHTRAVEVCRRGLEHHPSSILGRVTWGRALLEGGDTKGAMDQFEIAIALEPASPYAYNHVGEALVAKGLHREALPVLARAAELQPGDARLRAWLGDAKRRAKEQGPAAAQQQKKIALEDQRGGESTQPYGSLAPAAAAADRSEPPHPEPLPHLAPGEREGIPPAHPEGGAAEGSAESPSAHPERSAAEGGAESKGTSTADEAQTPPANETAAPPPLPPAAAQAAPKSVLYMIPGEGAREVVGPSLASRLNIPAAVTHQWPPPAAKADPAEAERAAARYERELREKLLAAPEPPPSFLHRHRRLVLVGAVAVALAAAGAVYLVVSARNIAILAAGAAVRARAGLARDTFASLTEAHRLLALARGRSTDPEVTSLAAQVAAVLAVEHGDDKAREEALALAESGTAGDGGIAARWLLAPTPEKRAAAEGAVLAAPPSAAPLVQVLAGRILISRGEREGGRGRLELAARANPPLLRALSDLGDLALAGGDPEGALAYYGAALAAHPTHARSVVGAAEARLAFGHDLETSRKELDAVGADAGSAPPKDLRVRFEIAHARVLAALGEPGPAAARLARATEEIGESALLAATVAELQLQARAWDKAEAAAGPFAPEAHLALGRILLAGGPARDAISPPERAVKLDPTDLAARRALGEARLAAGQPAAARADLDFVLIAAPNDAAALRLLSSAWLAEGQPTEARRAAERAVGIAPKDPAALLVAARATLASGDAAAARKLAARAVKAGASGAGRDEAKRLAAGQLPRKRG